MRIRIMRCLGAVLLLGLFGFADAQNLFREDAFQPLTGDHKGFRVGDAVTILVTENASAASTADTTAARKGNVGLNVRSPTDSRNYGIGPNNDFDGAGRTERTGKLLARITVSIRGFAPNGDLLLAGEQLVEINNERQRIKIEGRARPRDIGEQNSIYSYRLADATISYAGSGDLADRQQPSWWQRFMLWFGV